jgi:hypothetical protein
MYPDPNRVRCHRIAVNLDKYEYGLIEAYSNYTGIDKSRLVREMVMREAKRLLLEHHATQTDAQNPVPHS